MSRVAVRDKLFIPLVVGVGGFVLGIFGNEIKDRVFPPETTSAIESIDFQRAVTLRNYMRVTRNALGNYSDSQLRSVGFVVFADVKMTGYKDQVLHMDGTVLTSPNHSRVTISSPTVVGRYFRPSSNTAEQSPDIWIRDPCKRGRYYVNIVVAKDQRILSRKESRVITVPRRECEPPVR